MPSAKKSTQREREIKPNVERAKDNKMKSGEEREDIPSMSMENVESFKDVH